ncbi:hypothetical protein J6590_105868 [Homalodisca vitripennis]|nr:hypothetical protein J6590_105868 [Homalodisca vitripennis]
MGNAIPTNVALLGCVMSAAAAAVFLLTPTVYSCIRGTVKHATPATLRDKAASNTAAQKMPRSLVVLLSVDKHFATFVGRFAFAVQLGRGLFRHPQVQFPSYLITQDYAQCEPNDSDPYA